MTNEIKALQRRVDELQDQLSNAKLLLHQAQCEALGIAKGDVIKDRKGVEFLVSRIEIWGYGDKPSASLSGFKKSKEGWSKRDQYIGTEWTKQ